MTRTLLERHEDVPAEHYDVAIKKNVFQKYWHFRRFMEVDKFVIPVSGNILDVGCHSGLFTSRIIKKMDDVGGIYGVDVSRCAIDRAKKRIPKGHFKIADAHKLPFPGNFFNAVFCLEVIEHVDYPQQVISEIKRVLKRGGYAILLVPTDNLLFKIIWFLWTLKYKVWRHTHIQSFNGDKLEKLIESNKLKIIESKKFNLGMLKMVKFIKV